MISGNVRSPVAPARPATIDSGSAMPGEEAASSTDFASALADQLKPGSPRGMAPGARDRAVPGPKRDDAREAVDRETKPLERNDQTQEAVPPQADESPRTRAGELAASRPSTRPVSHRETPKPGRHTVTKEGTAVADAAKEPKADSEGTALLTGQLSAERGTEILMTSTCTWMLLSPLEEVPVPKVDSDGDESQGRHGETVELLTEQGDGSAMAGEAGVAQSRDEALGRKVPALNTYPADSSANLGDGKEEIFAGSIGKPNKITEKPHFTAFTAQILSPVAPVENAGTPAAKPDLDMSKKTELDMLNSPFTEELSPVQELHRIPVQWQAVEVNPAEAVAATLKPDVAQVVENALPTSQTHLGVVDQTHTIERIEKLMLNEVVVMRQSRPESLSVVLEPDKHTRLFVQMSTQDGAIQAAVRCEAGDVARLQTHWKELQQSLAREGVELRDLEFSLEQRSGANLNFSSNQQKSQREAAAEAGQTVVAESPRKAAKPVPMARRADDATRQLLEFWA